MTCIRSLESGRRFWILPKCVRLKVTAFVLFKSGQDLPIIELAIIELAVIADIPFVKEGGLTCKAYFWWKTAEL
jgi:hypothetical protein